MTANRTFAVMAVGVVVLVYGVGAVADTPPTDLTARVKKLELRCATLDLRVKALEREVEALQGKRATVFIPAKKEVADRHAVRPVGRPSRPSERVSKLSYYSMRQKMASMTEAQWKDYARSINGQRVQWTGWVEDVNEKFFGGYELWVDMDSPDELLSLQDVTFDIPADLALKLRKDTRVTFSGTIGSALDVLGSCSVNLEDATVINW